MVGVDLSRYDAGRHDPGARLLSRILWYLVNAAVFDSWWVPSSWVKRGLLRAFGARVGSGVVVKPRVNVKYPWRLEIGESAWIGEGAWIDNIAQVRIGANACISQGAYLCTGNHDWSDPRFGLRAQPITIGDQAWVGAFAVICPGVVVGEGAVVAAGSVLSRNADPWTVYASEPARPVRARRIVEPVSDMAGPAVARA